MAAPPASRAAPRTGPEAPPRLRRTAPSPAGGRFYFPLMALITSSVMSRAASE
jgi:hypothetical protein